MHDTVAVRKAERLEDLVDEGLQNPNIRIRANNGMLLISGNRAHSSSP